MRTMSSVFYKTRAKFEIVCILTSYIELYKLSCKMYRSPLFFLLIFAASYVRAVRECERITIDDLRSTENDRQSSLLVQTYNPNINPSRPSIVVEEMNIVCEAPGTTRDTYRYVSVVVRQICSGTFCGDTDGESVLVQYDFECDVNNEWKAEVLGADGEDIREEDPEADLDTESVNVCSACGKNLNEADDVTHCRACPTNCNEGLELCDGFGTNECCNYYLDDKCVAECPDTHATNDSYTCLELIECPLLKSPNNGTVEYDEDRFYPSVAVYECDEGFELDGDEERLCEIEGEWAGDPPECIEMSKDDGEEGIGEESGDSDGGDGSGSNEGDGDDGMDGQKTTSNKSSSGLTNAEIGIIIGVTVLLFIIIVGVFVILIAVWACG